MRHDWYDQSRHNTPPGSCLTASAGQEASPTADRSSDVLPAPVDPITERSERPRLGAGWLGGFCSCEQKDGELDRPAG